MPRGLSFFISFNIPDQFIVCISQLKPQSIKVDNTNLIVTLKLDLGFWFKKSAWRVTSDKAQIEAKALKEYRFKLGGEIGVDAGVPMIDSQAISRPYLQVCKCFPRNPPASLSLHPFCVKSSI
jgi:hypothetical protein